MEKTVSQKEPQRLEVLKKQRDVYTHKLFLLMLEFLFVFGVPAALAVYFGKALDAGTGQRTWTITLAISAFVLSWIIVIFRIRSIMSKLNKFEEEINNLQNHA